MLSYKKQTLKGILLIATILLGLLLIFTTSVFGTEPVAYQTTEPISLAGLPEGSELLVSEKADEDSETDHILSRRTVSESGEYKQSGDVYTYLDGTITAYSMPITGVVFAYEYKFDSIATAKNASVRLWEEDLNLEEIKAAYGDDFTKYSLISPLSNAFRVIGSEGTSIFYASQVNEKTLKMIMIEGFETEDGLLEQTFLEMANGLSESVPTSVQLSDWGLMNGGRNSILLFTLFIVSLATTCFVWVRSPKPNH